MATGLEPVGRPSTNGCDAVGLKVLILPVAPVRRGKVGYRGKAD